MNKEDLIITNHAKDKYRALDAKCPERDIEFMIRQLFEKSNKEPMSAGLIKRVMQNNFQEAEYYRFGSLRFVVCNDNILVTIEEDQFGYSGEGYIKKNTSKRR
ncbi:hypothetical protein LCGC14_1052350 [marine sediment metagenome]|uniref:DUF3781 domain-containing protein n=1 Tax=marine sediment metagenome TaxID=412755 RepID=A0A0F9Q6M2_9ZZZZ